MASLFSRRRRAPAASSIVTAASKQVSPTPDEVSQAHLKKAEGWQSRVWELYDEIGEVRFASRFMGDAQSRLDLYVGIRPSPKDDPIPLDSDGDEELGYTNVEAAAADDALERLSSPLGGRREIQRAFGVHLFVPGECYLVGEPDPADYPDLDERWDVYSVDEVKFEQKSGTERIVLTAPGRSASDGGRMLAEDAVAYRIWRAHPRYSQWADSPMRSALGILEELWSLTKAIHSATTSRLKGPGVLFLPNSMRDGNLIVGVDGAPDEDRLVTDFIKAAGTAIKDQGSAFAQVPLVVYMDDERWAEMGSDKLLRWDQGVDKIMAQLRAELLQRFATAIDLPPEILTGKGGLNHWTAWLISDDAFRNHIEPLAMLIVDALTVNYLRPALTEMGVENADRFEIWYDAASLVSDPDKGQRALDALDHELISKQAGRRELGYSEEDAPDADEEPDEPVDEPADEVEPEPDPEQAPAKEEPPAQGPPDASVIALAVTDTFARRLTARLNVADMALLRDAHAHVDQVMRRALEKANARVRSLALKDATARTLIECVQSGGFEEAPILGAALVRRLTAAEDDEAAAATLMAVTLARAGQWWDARLDAEADALIAELDLPDPQADQARVDLAERRDVGRLALMAGLTVVAARLLQHPDGVVDVGEADGSLVPPGLVRDALRAAGGGGEHAASYFTGDLIDRLLREAGYVATAYRWVYGPESWRRRPFEPHRALDGLEFADPDDEQLANPSLGWPGVSLYWPGDHPGCLCHLERTALEPVRTPSLLANQGAR